ncbi:MAG TPA: MFS transporter, partial [Salinisphaeraceae bacterium]|nr:MFS transporter [Salinisphaeraceae bacterium]
RVIAAIAACVAICSLAIVLLSGQDALPVIGLAILWGAFAATLYPLSVALVNDQLAASQFVSASAALLLMNSVGMVLGSIAAGEAMAAIGADGLFWVATLTAVVLAAFTGLHQHVLKPVPAQEPAPYQTLPRNSPYASTLDPRGDVAVQLELDFETAAPGGASSPSALTKSAPNHKRRDTS